MRIPSEPLQREQFYLDLIGKCLISREERKADYAALRSYFLFGSAPEDAPAIFNKIYPHIDQLSSFLYSAEMVISSGSNLLNDIVLLLLCYLYNCYWDCKSST